MNNPTGQTDAEIDEVFKPFLEDYPQFSHEVLQMKDELATLIRKRETAMLERQITRWRGWLDWIQSGGGHINRRQVKDVIAELEAELNQQGETAL